MVLVVCCTYLFFAQKCAFEKGGVSLRISETNKEMKEISLFALKEVRNCPKGYELSKLHLNYNGGEQSAAKVVCDAFEVLKKAFYQRRLLEETLAEVSVVLEALTLRKNELLAAHTQNKGMTMERFSQMAKYLWEQPGKRCINVPLHFECGGYYFSDKVDIVLEENGNFRLIYLNKDGRKSEFSSRARILENKPEYSLPNLFIHAAGYASAETWYLRSKDERADYVPEFEYRPEKNIVRTHMGSEEARNYLVSLWNTDEKTCGDCKSCRHSDVCQMKEVRIERPVDIQEAKAEPNFTDQQQEAVEHHDGPMALLAVPGAGKTTVLVHRLLRLLSDGVPASDILFIAFTNKAANEIRERVRALLPPESDMPNIYTFNAFGFDLLKEYALLVGNRVKIADDDDKKRMIVRVLEDSAAKGEVLENQSYAGALMERGIVNRMYEWFENISKLGKERFAEWQGGRITCPMESIFVFYDRYMELFRENHYISFDEQITLTNEIFAKYPSVVKRCAEKYRYIMVDEFQDASDEQAKMIYTIAHQHNNIVVVGDDDQSIYGFRGGSNKHLLHFSDEFPEAKIIVMADNFRSNEQILAAAESVIKENKARYQKKMKGHFSAKNKPLIFRESGVEKVAEIIPKLLKQYRPGDIAILARQNKRLVEVENALSGTVKVLSAKDYLIDDAVFQIVLDVLTLYYNTSDDVALYRTLKRLGVTEFPQKESSMVPLYEAIRDEEPMFTLDHYDMYAMEESYSSCNTEMMVAGRKLFRILQKLQCFRTMESVFDMIAETFKIPSGHKVFTRLLEACDERSICKTSELYDYMQGTVMFDGKKRVGYDASPDAVSLLTAHDAKGKEFPVVVIYATEDFADISDEANSLLYVAMTRAKNTLIMIEGINEKSILQIGDLRNHVTIR